MTGGLAPLEFGRQPKSTTTMLGIVTYYLKRSNRKDGYRTRVRCLEMGILSCPMEKRSPFQGTPPDSSLLTLGNRGIVVFCSNGDGIVSSLAARAVQSHECLHSAASEFSTYTWTAEDEVDRDNANRLGLVYLLPSPEAMGMGDE
ncbi:hypothetical protein CHU98_g4628 [Xylaria longipes]|nr:hypothetical protein CHU98_g4628 [Xylaria longipes]